MKVWNRLPLAAKLLVPICGALVIGLSISTYIVSRESSSETTALSMDLGRSAVQNAAEAVKLRFNSAFNLARLVAQNAATLQAEKGGREALARAVMDSTRTASELVGSWVEFAPDAFDADDGANVASETLTHDGRGRVSIYAVNSPEGAKLQANSSPMVDINTQDYFGIPFRSGKETVIEPYSFPVNGKNVLMTSLAVPIVVNGKTIGVAGVDIDLTAI